jgi:hypothetical protein
MIWWVVCGFVFLLTIGAMLFWSRVGSPRPLRVGGGWWFGKHRHGERQGSGLLKKLGQLLIVHNPARTVPCKFLEAK